jgi:hypothetical protein
MSHSRKRDTLHGFVLGKCVTPQPIQGRRLFAPESEEEVSDVEVFDQSASAAIQIVYVDRHGEESERPVSCRQIITRGWPEAVFGYCHERQARAQKPRLGVAVIPALLSFVVLQSSVASKQSAPL